MTQLLLTILHNLSMIACLCPFFKPAACNTLGFSLYHKSSEIIRVLNTTIKYATCWRCILTFENYLVSIVAVMSTLGGNSGYNQDFSWSLLTASGHKSKSKMEQMGIGILHKICAMRQKAKQVLFRNKSTHTSENIGTFLYHKMYTNTFTRTEERN